MTMKFLNGIIMRLKNFTSIISCKLRFKSFGITSVIVRPLHIDGAKNISIGDHTLIQYKTWLGALPLTGFDKVELSIGSNCIIGHFNEIYATRSIVIENRVLIADRVFISDNQHAYSNPQIPILNQGIVQKNNVVIGEGSWIGVGVVILGAKIGKNCIIGANSVVTQDIPDYSVAAGIPAKIIKQFNFKTSKWESV